MPVYQDPTYVASIIEANPAWSLAFRMSEVINDEAPLGWSRYIILAQWLLRTFRMEERPRG